MRLLLASMLREHPNRLVPAHMSLTGSTRHLDVDLDELARWTDADGIIGHLNKPEDYPGPSAIYQVTKLLAHYAMAEIADLAKDEETGR